MTPSTQPVFFIDWCFGKTVVNALREAGALIEHHGDHFEQNALDTEWLPVVGDRGWVVLTKDKAIAKNQLELMAIARAEVKVFILTSGNLTRQDMADILVDVLGKLKNLRKVIKRLLLPKSPKIDELNFGKIELNFSRCWLNYPLLN